MSLSCDRINACVIIPVFNHARTVGEVVKGSLEHSRTVLVCDDGSSDGSGDRAREAGGTLLVHPQNLGKGAALKTLFAEAARLGFRYVICLDADGQHFPSDIPVIVDAVAEDPGCVVVGSRDLAAAGAPGSSQFGRKFSNFWMWFEGDVRIEDSQSGFRAYPIPEALRLGGRRVRYDFEIEILLRSAWAGLPIHSAKIGVLYPKDRVTHFKAFKDNVRISLLNTLTCLRLLLPLPLAPLIRERPHRPGLSLDALRRWVWLGGAGPLHRAGAAALGAAFGLWGALASAVMGAGAVPAAAATLLWRIEAFSAWPWWLRGFLASLGGFAFGWLESALRARQVRRASEASPRPWTGRRRGGVVGNGFFIVLLKLFGPRPAYWFLYPVTAYFVLAAPEARRAGLQYLARVLGPSRGFASIRRAYRHLLAFAHTILDRAIFGIIGPSAFHLEEDGIHHIVEASGSGKGSILLTAHVGNWDFAGAMLRGQLKAPLSIVAYENEAAAIQKLLDRPQQHFRVNVLKVGGGELGALDILRALREGHMVAMQGDRTLDERVAVVDFFGAPAAFPVGPFVMAALSGAPMIATFSVQEGKSGHYRMKAFPPQTYRFERGRGRDEQLRDWVQDYARKMESLLREHPYQWFNFYDFWAVHRPSAIEAPAAPRPALPAPSPDAHAAQGS